jgi:hypothetical protein
LVLVRSAPASLLLSAWLLVAWSAPCLAEHYPVRRFSPAYVRLAGELRRLGLPFDDRAGLTAKEFANLEAAARSAWTPAPAANAPLAPAANAPLAPEAGWPASGIAFASPPSWSLPDSVTDLALGDFDRDGRSDAAVVGPSSVTTLSGTAGGFAAAVVCPAGGATLAVADFDGDGWLDLATDRVQVLLNRSGTLAVAAELPVADGFGLAAGDLDGDARPELVVLCGAPWAARLLVLRNQGGGSFAVAGEVPAPGEPSRVILADLDGDGRLDAAVGQRYGSPASVALFFGDGAGGLAAPLEVETDQGVLGLVAADFDGDGRTDLIAAGDDCYESSVTLLRNLGGRAFVGSVVKRFDHDYVLDAVADDFDRDGHMDIALATQTRWVSPMAGRPKWIEMLWNDGAAGFSAASRLHGSDEFLSPGVLRVADMDGNGNADVVALNDLSGHVYTNFEATLSVLGDEGARRFTAIDCFDWETPDWTFWHEAQAGRFRATGPDIVASDSRGLWLIGGTGDGRFQPPLGLGVGTPAAAADLDADGFDDLVVANADTIAVRLCDRNGGFLATAIYPHLTFVALTDVDGDRRLDLAAVDASSRLVVLKGQPDGSFATSVASDLTLAGSPALAAGDLDGDGRSDLVFGLGCSGQDSVAVLLQREGLHFDPLPRCPVGPADGWFGSPQDVELGDFDRDGVADIALSAGGVDVPGYVSALIGDGAGGVRSVSDFPTGGKDANVLGIADLDQDGFLDLSALNVNDEYFGGIRLFRGDAGGALAPLPGPSPRGTYLVGWGPTVQVIADFTGDGRPDLAIGNSQPWSFSLLRNVSTPGAPTPIAATLIAAQAEPGCVRLSWEVNGGAGDRFTVERRTAAEAWSALASIDADGRGRIEYEDHGVRPGERYAYRLGLGRGASEPASGEVWVEVPEGVGFALAGVRPNPSPGGDLTVSFSLDAGGPATLELLDVAGRRVRTHRVRPEPGAHEIHWSGSPRLAAGLYLVRLRQGDRERSTKVCVIE